MSAIASRIKYARKRVKKRVAAFRSNSQTVDKVPKTLTESEGLFSWENP